MIGLVMATMLEAAPFIRSLSLTKVETAPFPVYHDGRFHLIISGIGKANSAMACAYLIQAFRPTCILNLGAAGAAGKRHGLGEYCHITSVIEPDRPHLKTGTPHRHCPDILAGFSEAVLATQDRPLLDREERGKVAIDADLVDMEGASVVQTCLRFGVKCFLFKFVSDTPDHDQSAHVIKNIELYRDGFCRFFTDEVVPALLSAKE